MSINYFAISVADFVRYSRLVDTTTTEEENDVFITKIALSMGRSILRPKVENELSIQDRHPTSKHAQSSYFV